MGTSNTVAPVKKTDAVAGKHSDSTRPMELVQRLIKEPLIHFLVLGALLFLYFQSKGGEGPGSNRIVITNGDVEHLAAGFVLMWQRQPTREELKGLIDDYVKDEIATREALAMGLDRNDPIIRRRLRQKLEFLTDDTVSGSAPTDAQLQTWLSNHPDAFRGEPQV